ncbi:MAG TPA: class IV adenylate cyclase, partial [Pirellulaceae bacterium]|nr:class IV adenylate cyclase [Pirellulaceae bacterium]
PERQVDTYFQHPARDFRQTDEALRIRQIGDDNYITYKGPKLDALTKTRHELELPLAVGHTAAAQFVELLAALGFQPAGVVTKLRRSATLIWSERQIELAWDQIDGLGEFLELEIVAASEELEAARAAVLDLATRWGLTTAERRSYLELQLAAGDEIAK